MGSIDRIALNLKLLDIIDEWHRDESGNQYITGDIDAPAKERLARTLELVFCQENSASKLVPPQVIHQEMRTVQQIEPRRRGRPPKCR